MCVAKFKICVYAHAFLHIVATMSQLHFEWLLSTTSAATTSTVRRVSADGVLLKHKATGGRAVGSSLLVGTGGQKYMWTRYQKAYTQKHLWMKCDKAFLEELNPDLFVFLTLM